MRRAPVLAGLVVLVGLVLALAACGGEETVSPTAETVVGTLPEEESEAPSEVEGDAAAGADVYTSAGCGTCHTLEDAGSTGTVGPNLDESQPDLELVLDRVTNGQGAMPPFQDTLSEQEIADVAAYVVDATSG
jgi:mono/diheme cytochrome c family protein